MYSHIYIYIYISRYPPVFSYVFKYPQLFSNILRYPQTYSHIFPYAPRYCQNGDILICSQNIDILIYPRIYSQVFSNVFVDSSGILKYSQICFHLYSYVPMCYQSIDILIYSQNIDILRGSHVFSDILRYMRRDYQITSGILIYIVIYIFMCSPCMFRYCQMSSGILTCSK